MKHFHYSICKFVHCDFSTVNDNNNERQKLWFVIRIMNGILDTNHIGHQKQVLKKRNVLHFTLVNKQQSLKFKSNSKMCWVRSNEMSKLKSSQHNEIKTEKHLRIIYLILVCIGYEMFITTFQSSVCSSSRSSSAITKYS